MNIKKYLTIFFFVIASLSISQSRIFAQELACWGNTNVCHYGFGDPWPVWDVFASCCGNGNGTCTFSQIFYQPTAYDYWCAGSTGSGDDPVCTYSSCTDCTLPTCPAVNGGNSSYTTTKPVDADGNTIASPLVACVGNSISCTGEDNCGDDCNPQGPNACYLPETNLTAIPTPIWNKLQIGSRLSGNLSTSSATPTRVPFPLSTTEATESSTNTENNPTGSRELRYNFTVSGGLTTLTTNILSNKPTAASLTQGSTGSITTSYSTLNKCEDNVRTGAQLTTYYEVNKLPIVDPNISASLTISGNNKNRGCEATSYTGKVANNPLTVTIVGKDSDGSADINGAILWLVKHGSSLPVGYLNKMYPVGTVSTNTDPNIIGLFIGLNDARTVSTVYKSNNSSGNLINWGSDSGSTRVRNASGDILINEIEVLSLTENALTQTFTFVLRLTFPTDSPIAGNYRFYTTATDKLTYYNANSVELRTLYNNNNWQWNFDFVDPIITGYGYVVPAINQREIDLSWVNDGTGSNVKDTVVNVYINPDSQIQVRRLNPLGGLINTIEKPGADAIGLITPTIISGWYNNSSLQNSNIDIGDNSSGTMSFFTTIYDQSCNYFTTSSDTSREYNLNKWIATKGGIFYSDDVVSYVPKDIGEYNLGTELVTTTSDYPQVRSFGEPNLSMNPVLVRSVKDTNDTNSDIRFNFLLEKHKKMVEESTFTTLSSLGPCPTKCILLASTIGANGATTTYSGKIIVLSDVPNGDINVYPDIVAANPATDGLIIFSEGNINIVGTHRKSNAVSLRTDRIEAMMIAKNGITITKESLNPSDQQDRVEIQGSLIGFGADNTGTSVLVERNLGLQNINYPVLNVLYHPKYAKLSELFFGTDTTTYKQEVGFKF